MVRHFWPSASLIAFAAWSLAQTPTSNPAGRRIDLVDSAIPLSKALDEVRRLTGVRVGDDRGQPDRDISLKLDKASFWQAVDAIAAAAAGAGVSQSPRDGSVSLIRKTPGEQVPPTSYDGDFRVRAVRVTASRDLDSGRRTCIISLEVTWTPTLRPLFLDTQPQGVRLLDSKGRPVAVPDQGSSLAPVDGRFALSFDLALPGLPRSESHIGLIEGRFVAVAPTRMLTFRFDADLKTLQTAVADGEQRRLTQDDVVCRIDRIVTARDRWSVRVALAYPPGNRRLESFQAGSLVANNELTLVRRDGKRTLAPSGSVIDVVSSRRAVVTYHFGDRKGAPPGKPDDWRPRYTAPARVVDVPVRFAFRKLDLP
jgi:hypothetical protein